MTDEEMDEYAEHAAAKFNDLVRRRGKEWVKARLDKGVEYYMQRLGDGKWLKEFERAHKAHSKD